MDSNNQYLLGANKKRTLCLLLRIVVAITISWAAFQSSIKFTLTYLSGEKTL